MDPLELIPSKQTHPPLSRSNWFKVLTCLGQTELRVIADMNIRVTSYEHKVLVSGRIGEGETSSMAWIRLGVPSFTYDALSYVDILKYNRFSGTGVG